MTDNVIISFMTSAKMAADIKKIQNKSGYHNRSDTMRNMVRKQIAVELGDE